MSERIYAVLTGDLVKSTRLSPEELERARTTSASAADTVRSWREGLIDRELEFFRGDSWQLLLNDPIHALRAAIYLRAVLRSAVDVDTRIAIGIGRVDVIDPTRVSLSSGEAFTLSGRALDQLSSNRRMTIALPARVALLGPWMPVVAELCDGIIAEWQRRQAEIISFALTPESLSQEEIAKRLKHPLTQQAVAKSLRGAGLQFLVSAIQQFERTPWSEICQGRPGTEALRNATHKGCIRECNQKWLRAASVTPLSTTIFGCISQDNPFWLFFPGGG